MLDLLKQNAAKEGVTNITTILGTETDPRLPAHGVDRLLLVDVYHEFQKPRADARPAPRVAWRPAAP